MYQMEVFYYSFLNEVNKRISMETYKGNLEQYTSCIMDVINSIINRTCKAQNEYFRIDAVGWTTSSEEYEEDGNKVGLNAHVWDLKIAVEHENSVKDWTDEVIKLLHVRCPLKVVIGYNHYDIRYDEDDNESDNRKLEFVAKCMKKVKAFEDQSKEDYLIIIGNAKGKKKHDSAYTEFGYRGYYYDYQRGCFIDINERKNL